MFFIRITAGVAPPSIEPECMHKPAKPPPTIAAAGATPPHAITLVHPMKEEHSKWDPILLEKIAKYTGFCVYRRSYLVFNMVPP